MGECEDPQFKTDCDRRGETEPAGAPTEADDSLGTPVSSRRQFIRSSARKLAYTAPIVAALAASRPGTAGASGSTS